MSWGGCFDGPLRRAQDAVSTNGFVRCFGGCFDRLSTNGFVGCFDGPLRRAQDAVSTNGFGVGIGGVGGGCLDRLSTNGFGVGTKGFEQAGVYEA